MQNCSFTMLLCKNKIKKWKEKLWKENFLPSHSFAQWVDGKGERKMEREWEMLRKFNKLLSQWANDINCWTTFASFSLTRSLSLNYYWKNFFLSEIIIEIKLSEGKGKNYFYYNFVTFSTCRESIESNVIMIKVNEN